MSHKRGFVNILPSRISGRAAPMNEFRKRSREERSYGRGAEGSVLPVGAKGEEDFVVCRSTLVTLWEHLWEPFQKGAEGRKEE